MLRNPPKRNLLLFPAFLLLNQALQNLRNQLPKDNRLTLLERMMFFKIKMPFQLPRKINWSQTLLCFKIRGIQEISTLLYFRISSIRYPSINNYLMSKWSRIPIIWCYPNLIKSKTSRTSSVCLVCQTYPQCKIIIFLSQSYLSFRKKSKTKRNNLKLIQYH